MRASRRQAVTCCGATPCRRATSTTRAPGSKLSATIRAFTASDQLRRPVGPAITSSRSTTLRRPANEKLRTFLQPVRIGFEATGNYHRTLAHHLGRAGFELKLVSSVCLARTREALHNSWDKNDPKDAQVILQMLEIGAVQFFHDPMVVGTADIQELSKTHEIVSRSKTELWHRILTHYLPLYFPEAERFHRSSRTDWFLAFLEKYPSPHMISAMSREAFVADAWDVVGRKVSKEHLLSDIYATAVASVGLPVHAILTRCACSALFLPRGEASSGNAM